MSDCTLNVDALLDADPDELSGAADSEVGRHVRDCPQCRDAARTILEATDRLRAVLDAPPPPLDVDAVLARAKRRRPLAGRWLAVAAAALLAGLWLFGERERPLPGEPPPPRPEAYPLVEASGDRDVAVIPTANPEITVLWFF